MDTNNPQQPNTPLTTDQKLDRLFAIVATKDDIAELKQDIASLKAVADQHTVILDGIVKQLAAMQAERTALEERWRRYDKFMEIVAQKLNLDLKSLFS